MELLRHAAFLPAATKHFPPSETCAQLGHIPRREVHISATRMNHETPEPRFGWSRRLVGIALMSLLLVGCTQIDKPDQADCGEQVPVDAFLHEHLQAQPMVTVGEAYRAMILLADGDDTYNSFAAREEALLAIKAVRPEWKLERDQIIDRGTVAYMVAQIIKAPGGVNFNLLGRNGVGDRRYAVREMAYLDLMDTRPSYRYMTGAELVDLLGKADAYMAKHGLYDEEPVDIAEMVPPPTTQLE